ncbi:hypothetical protein EJB05_04219, partial [Eragrostis curvula]
MTVVVRAAWTRRLLSCHQSPTGQSLPHPVVCPSLSPAAAAKARRLLPTPDLVSPPTSDRYVNPTTTTSSSSPPALAKTSAI